MAKRWQKADVAVLKRYARSKPVAELAARLRTDVASVRAKLKELGGAAPARAAKAAKGTVKAGKGDAQVTKRTVEPARPAAKPAKRAKRPAPPKKVAAKPAQRAAKPAGATAKPAKPAAAKRAARPVAAAPARPTPAPQPTPPPKPNPDTARLLPLFEQGLQAMHRHAWPTAIGLFSRLVAAGDDEPELTGRARQFLAICEERQAENGAEREAEDPYVLAVYHRNRGDLGTALSVARRGQRHKRDERLAYLVAALYAERGEAAEAVEALGLAIELNPLNRGQALVDPDFAELRERGELSTLLRRTP